MPRSLQRELDVAVAAAEAGGRAALASFGMTLHVDWKSDDSPVSEADRAADAAIRASIDATFPDDGVLSEESGARPGTSGRRWLIDPVDGTRAFLRGLPHWCTLVALEAGNEIVVSVLAFPSLGRVYRAARGHGAWRGETRLEIASPPALARCSLVLGEIDLIADRLGSHGFLTLVRAVGSSSSYGAGYGARPSSSTARPMCGACCSRKRGPGTRTSTARRGGRAGAGSRRPRRSTARFWAFSLVRPRRRPRDLAP